MPDTILSDLGSASLPLAGTELTYVVQGGTSKHTPVSELDAGAKPAAHSTTVTLADTDHGKNLILTGTVDLVVDEGRRAGFLCRFKGTIGTITGTATVNDVRTTGATNPWCELLAIGTDAYDLVGSKA